MLIQASIVAGRILSLLDEENRAISFREMQYHLEESMPLILAGVEKLVKEELAVLDVDTQKVKIVAIPDFGDKEIKAKHKFFKRMADV